MVEFICRPPLGIGRRGGGKRPWDGAGAIGCGWDMAAEPCGIMDEEVL
jgi:hypothetical protein